MGTQDPRTVWKEYQAGIAFKQQIGLFETVRNNENFYLGRQWEGIASNGLPTPVFNVLKRIVSHLVASLVSDDLKLNAAPLFGAAAVPHAEPDAVTALLNRRFAALFERNKIGNLIRAYVRNACVDGDGCLYTYFDPDAETGSLPGGEIVTELVENTRLVFGNPNDGRIERQPYLILSLRRPVDEVREMARRAGGDPGLIRPDADDARNWHDALTDDKCTVLLKFRRDKQTKRILAYRCTAGAQLQAEWDTGLRRYPLTWFSVDAVQNCCHGQATITGLIDNQIFINKMLAGAMLSLMTAAYPKVLYDRTRIAKWDNRIGAAIAMQGGDVGTAARVMDPAHISPQVAQFISLVADMTKNMCGATEAAIGEARAYNTSALLSQQRAAAVPHELMRRNLYETIEDLGRIYLDHMAAYYGTRPSGVSAQDGRPLLFDFALLRSVPLSLKLDVGAASCWSEVSALQTLDTLLQRKEISIVQYLERVPDEFVPRKHELLEELSRAAAMTETPALIESALPGE